MFTRLSSLFLFTSLLASPLQADTVHIMADRDNTLIEFEAGQTANGSGPSFFAGHTNQAEFGIRRGLVRFDVAAALPENALIDRAFVSLYQSSGNTVPSAVSLHRVLADWGEGASFSSGGSGAPAEENDATWQHTFYAYDYWVKEGGHFIPHASAIATVGGKDFFTWQSNANLVNDVRLWLHAPQQNYGWLVMGNEETRGSVKRFTSREGADSNQYPMLTIEYHLPGE
jgi:hypothetical protein